jgi:hypothetical protein
MSCASIVQFERMTAHVAADSTTGKGRYLEQQFMFHQTRRIRLRHLIVDSDLLARQYGFKTYDKQICWKAVWKR